jgi:hypothetical protein
MLNLSVSLDFFEWMVRCARLGAISLDVLHCNKRSEHHEYQLLSRVIYFVNSFAGFALSAVSALRESATFSRFDATGIARRADHQLNFFVVKT